MAMAPLAATGTVRGACAGDVHRTPSGPAHVAATGPMDPTRQPAVVCPANPAPDSTSTEPPPAGPDRGVTATRSATGCTAIDGPSATRAALTPPVTSASTAFATATAAAALIGWVALRWLTLPNDGPPSGCSQRASTDDTTAARVCTTLFHAHPRPRKKPAPEAWTTAPSPARFRA
jgi:hypothetical protein